MSAPAFQSALARLIVDPDFRDAVRERGTGAVPGQLSGLEEKRLLAVASDPGLEITRTLHKGFRLGKLLNQLPLTCTLLDRDVLSREVGEFWRRRLPTGFYYLEEAVGFCDHLLRRAGQSLDVPYLEEIVAYERAGLELQRARPAGAPPPPQTVFFLHEPLPLISALSLGEIPEEVAERPSILVGTRQNGATVWRSGAR